MKKIWKIQVKFLFVVVIPRLTGIIPAKLVSVSWCFLFRVNLVQKLDLCGWITKVYKRSIFVTQIGVPTTFSNTTLFLNRLQVGYVLSFGMRPHPSNSGHQEYYICYCYRVGPHPDLRPRWKVRSSWKRSKRSWPNKSVTTAAWRPGLVALRRGVGWGFRHEA